MPELSDFCFRCPCEPASKECMMNTVLLQPNGNYQCKMQRYQRNLLRQVLV